MKKKLLVGVIAMLMIPAHSAHAEKPEEQRTPKWVKQAWNAGMRCPKLEDDLRRIGLPVKGFSYLAYRESRCRAKVVGWNYHKGMNHLNCEPADVETYKNCAAVDSFDSGLWQVNSTWVTLTAQVCGAPWGDLSVLRTKKCNLRVAKALFENGGYRHWRITR